MKLSCKTKIDCTDDFQAKNALVLEEWTTLKMNRNKRIKHRFKKRSIDRLSAAGSHRMRVLLRKNLLLLVRGSRFRESDTVTHTKPAL